MRAYVLAGVHGDAALFTDRIDRITADMAARATLPTHLILNGGLIGGPDSAGVILRAMQLGAPFADVAILRGYPETTLLAALEGNEDAAAHVPDEMLAGWGVAPWRLAGVAGAERVALLREAAPAAIHHWLLRRPAEGRIGGYILHHGRLYARRHRIRGDMIGLEGARRWTPVA